VTGEGNGSLVEGAKVSYEDGVTGTGRAAINVELI